MAVGEMTGLTAQYWMVLQQDPKGTLTELSEQCGLSVQGIGTAVWQRLLPFEFST